MPNHEAKQMSGKRPPKAYYTGLFTLDTLRRFLRPPDFGDNEKNTRAKLFNIILYVVLAFTVLLLGLYTILLPSPLFGKVLIFFALGVELISFVLFKVGRLEWAERWLVFSLWAVLMLSTLTADGVRGPSVLGEVLLIFMSGLLISERVAVSLGAISVFGNYLALMLETGPGLPVMESQLNLPAQWAVGSGYILLSLGLMLIFARSRRRAFDQVRNSEEALKDRVAELAQAQAQLEMSEQSLRRREAILKALSDAAERLFRDRSLKKAVQHVLKELGQATGADCVYVCENQKGEAGELLVSQRYEWTAKGVSPQTNDRAWQNLAYEDLGLGRWPKLLQKNQLIKGHVREFPESERELLWSRGALSVLIVPIFLGEKLWGFMGFEESKWEREWSPAEEEALRGAGGILGGAIERAHAEEALGRSEERYLGILQDQLDLICRYQPDGSLLFANEAYLQFCGIHLAHLEETNMWDLVQPERVAGLRAKVASLKPRDPVAVSQTLSRRGDGVMRWIEWTERGIFDQRGNLLEVQAVGRDIDEEVRLRKQLEETLIQTENLAMTDGLTGLLNRRAIMEHAEAEWQRAEREKRPLSLAIVDLDHLKQINDSLGHLTGDQALQQVAEAMRSGMRRYDWAGRWGGDEFLLVLPGADQQDAKDVAERLRKHVNLSKVKAFAQVALRVSIGLASKSPSAAGDTLNNLLARADQALYAAKQGGRDRVGVAG